MIRRRDAEAQRTRLKIGRLGVSASLRRILTLLAIALPLAAQVQTIPDTTFPIVRSMMNANFGLLQGGKLTPPVTYASGTTYLLGDTVAYAGLWYVSIQTANIGQAPSSSPLWWTALPAGAVGTVFGRTGAVVSAANDYSYSQLAGNPYSLFSGVSPISYNASTGAFSCSTCLTANAVSTVFGRAGAVVSAANDYSFSQLSGSATATQLPVIPVANGGLNTSAPAFTALTDGATVTWALGSALVASADLTFTVHSGSRTLNITGAVSGGQYVLWVKQDATGGEGLTLGTGCTWKVSGGGGGAVTPSTGASAVDLLAVTYDGTNCYAVFNKLFN
jgi:hypothetical protein